MSDVFTGHGGRLTHARAAFGGQAESWIDLSTGINPRPWPGVDRVPIDWRGLPDPTALAGLERAAAAYFGVDPACCCALPGSEAGLRLLDPLLGLPAWHMPPTYRSHIDAFPGSAPLPSPDHLSGEPMALVVANPNNPDGRLLPPTELIDWLGRIETTRGWMVVDEAFADCASENSIAAQVADDRRLIVLRSFGKFFGLAGLRLGFLLGPRSLLARVRDRIGEWPVSAAAIAIGTHAYRDRRWIAATRANLRRRADALDALLARRGLQASGACPLFRLVETPDANALFDRLARAAILTRPFAAHPCWLRIGLPAGAAETERLDGALAHDFDPHG